MEEAFGSIASRTFPILQPVKSNPVSVAMTMSDLVGILGKLTRSSISIGTDDCGKKVAGITNISAPAPFFFFLFLSAGVVVGRARAQPVPAGGDVRVPEARDHDGWAHNGEVMDETRVAFHSARCDATAREEINQ